MEKACWQRTKEMKYKVKKLEGEVSIGILGDLQSQNLEDKVDISIHFLLVLLKLHMLILLMGMDNQL